MNPKLLSTLEGIGAVAFYLIVLGIGNALLSQYVPSQYIVTASVIITGLANYAWDKYALKAFPNLPKPVISTPISQ